MSACLDTNPDPANITVEIWTLYRGELRHTCAYTQRQMSTLVASDVDLPTFKHKWDVLKKDVLWRSWLHHYF